MAHDNPQVAEESPVSSLMFMPLLIRVEAGMGDPSDQELKLINKFAPTAMTAADVFRFPSVASTNALDSYFTRMDRATSLNNFVKDMRAGAALLDSHFVYRLPLGLSYGASLDPIEEGQAEGVEASHAATGAFYIPRGVEVDGGRTTDSYIRGILTGIYRKMSIGFGGPDMRITCDIDGSDLYDWDSDFYPGMRLGEGKFATYTVFDARMYEASLVYKNATPGSLVQRIQSLITDRRIVGGEISRLAGTYGVRFDVPPFRVAFSDRTQGGKVKPEEVRAIAEGIITRAGATLSTANKDKIRSAADSATGIADTLGAMLEEADAKSEKDRAATGAVEAVRAATELDLTSAPGLDEARNLIAAGRAFRDKLIAEALAARVAVLGQAVATEEAQARIKARWERMPIADIQDEHTSWTAQRKDVFQSGRAVPPFAVPESANEATGGLIIEER
jgi:hypothetical protein